MKILKCLAFVIIANSVHAQILSGRNVTNTHTDYQNISASAGLKSFYFDFQNGDHHIKSIGIVKNLYNVSLNLNDNDGNDPFLYRAQYVGLGNLGRNGEVSTKNCKSNCSIKIPGLNPRKAFILAGFKFQFNKDDRHIKKISLLPNYNTGTVQVHFGDKSPTDPYSVRVQYLLVDRKNILKTGVASGHGGRGFSSCQNGNALIEGFSFEYTRDDHHLKTFGIEMKRGQIVTNFRDGGNNSGVKWLVRYVLLR